MGSQVDGCGRNLAVEKLFYRRGRCCSQHAMLLSVAVEGCQHRFCQKCCAFHADLSAFDGTKKCALLSLPHSRPLNRRPFRGPIPGDAARWECLGESTPRMASCKGGSPCCMIPAAHVRANRTLDGCR